MGLLASLHARWTCRGRFGLFASNYHTLAVRDEATLQRLFERIDAEYVPSPEVLRLEARQRAEYCCAPRPAGTTDEWHVWMTRELP